MAGGLLNLIAIGNQNVIINGNPTKTFWKSTYKRYTNFGLQNFSLNFEGQKSLQLSNETTFTFPVNRYADLLRGCYLVFSIPDIYSPAIHDSSVSKRLIDCTEISQWIPYEFKWIENLGAMIISNIRVLVGGALIQEISGYDIVAFANRDLSATEKKKWDQMTGNIPELYDPANVFNRNNNYPTATYQDDGAQPSILGREIYVPLPFWWGNTDQQAFPLVALQYSELTIEITTRPIQELFKIRDISDGPEYPYKAPNFIDSTQQFYIFLQTPPPPDPTGQLNYQNKNATWNGNIYLSANYCFLSEEERTLFATKEQNYLVKQIYDTWYLGIPMSGNLDLDNCTGLVTSFMFLFSRSDVKNRNEWTNFTNWPYLNHEPYPIKPAMLECPGEYSSSDQYFNNGNIRALSIIPRDNGTINYPMYSTGPYKEENKKEILTELGISFDASIRETPAPFGIYKYVQPYLSSSGFAASTLDGLYCYNFCLDTSPFKLQPSGAVNLSKFTQITLNFVTSTPSINPSSSFNIICDPESGNQIGVVKSPNSIYNYDYNLLVIEERFNVISFISGNAGLMLAR
jgi:hypothetical protein